MDMPYVLLVTGAVYYWYISQFQFSAFEFSTSQFSAISNYSLLFLEAAQSLEQLTKDTFLYLGHNTVLPRSEELYVPTTVYLTISPVKTTIPPPMYSSVIFSPAPNSFDWTKLLLIFIFLFVIFFIVIVVWLQTVNQTD